MSVSIVPGVRVLKPLDDGERWIIENPAGRRFGVSPDVVTIMSFIKECPDIDAANDRFGASNVAQVIDMFSGCSIFSDDHGESADDNRRRAHEWGRLRVDSLFSIQFTLLRNPSRIFMPFRRFGVREWSVAAIIALLISSAGIVGILADGAAFFNDLVTPQRARDYVLMVVMMVFIISLHEYAHGAVLSSFGGRVSRMGVMLLYLSPACFCDVSDGWRLSSKKRMMVASAGIISTFMLAGVCSLLRYIPGTPSFMATLVTSLYTGAIINAIPTVKFDGYIALMAWREQPFLRDKAMRQWKKAVAGLLEGNSSEAIHEFSGWSVYGVLCSCTPLVLIYSLYLVFDGSMGFSAIGATLKALLLWLMCFLIVHGWFEFLRCSFTKVGGRGARVPWKTALCSVSVCLVLLLTPVQTSRSTAYAYDGGGSIMVLTPYGEELPVGASLEVRQQGLIAYRVVGTAKVEGQVGVDQVPAGVYSPSLTWSTQADLQARVQRARMDVPEGVTLPAQGQVVWEGDGDSTLAAWLYRQMVSQPYLAVATALGRHCTGLR